MDEIQARTLEPVEPVGMQELAADRLERAIQLGHYMPSERLPEEDLVARLCVSRTTLRSALRMLQGRGYVVSRRGAGGGWFVRPGLPAATLGNQPANHSLSDVEQILDFREAVEGMATRLAARRRDAADLRQLRKSIDEMRASEALPPFRRSDNAFHLLIASMSWNPMLQEAIVKARSAMFGVVDMLDFKILLANSVEGHERILDAIAAGDEEEAIQASNDHIRVSRREWRDILRDVRRRRGRIAKIGGE